MRWLTLQPVGFPHHQDNPRDNHRDAQELSHIECHALLKGHLIFLEELDEETPAKATGEDKPKEAARCGSFVVFL